MDRTARFQDVLTADHLKPALTPPFLLR